MHFGSIGRSNKIKRKLFPMRCRSVIYLLLLLFPQLGTFAIKKLHLEYEPIQAISRCVVVSSRHLYILIVGRKIGDSKTNSLS